MRLSEMNFADLEALRQHLTFRIQAIKSRDQSMPVPDRPYTISYFTGWLDEVYKAIDQKLEEIVI